MCSVVSGIWGAIYSVAKFVWLCGALTELPSICGPTERDPSIQACTEVLHSFHNHNLKYSYLLVSVFTFCVRFQMLDCVQCCANMYHEVSRLRTLFGGGNTLDVQGKQIPNSFIPQRTLQHAVMTWIYLCVCLCESMPFEEVSPITGVYP